MNKSVFTALAAVCSSVLLACTPARSGAPVPTNTSNAFACKVVSVADGDTITCLSAGNQQNRIRLAQIDAPERGQPFGNVARKALADKVAGQEVRIVVEDTDRYHRLVAEVFYQGRNINMEMVQEGFAWAYLAYMRNPVYAQLEQQARKAGGGLWADKNPMAPWDYRKLQRSQP